MSKAGAWNNDKIPCFFPRINSPPAAQSWGARNVGRVPRLVSEAPHQRGSKWRGFPHERLRRACIHVDFSVNCQLSTVNCQLSTVNYQLSTIN